MFEGQVSELSEFRAARLPHFADQDRSPRAGRPVIAIEAAMGSSHLPGSALLPICGRPLLRHVVARMSNVSGASVVVVTTDSPRDLPIRQYCRRNGIEFFAGSSSDPLDRLYRAALRFGADPIIRVSAQAAFIDPLVISRLLELHADGGFDLARVATGEGTIFLEGGRYPRGFEAECVSLWALERAWSEATDPADREAAFSYLTRAVGRFRVGTLRAERNLSHLRLEVESETDLELARRIYAELDHGEGTFSLDDVLGFLNGNPELLGVNRSFVGAETGEELAIAA